MLGNPVAQLRVVLLECGGKRSATPLWPLVRRSVSYGRAESQRAVGARLPTSSAGALHGAVALCSNPYWARIKFLP